MEPSARRPPVRKLLVQLVVLGGWTAAIVAIDKAAGDEVAVVVTLLGYGGYIAWYFWSNRYH